MKTKLSLKVLIFDASDRNNLLQPTNNGCIKHAKYIK